MDSGSADNVMPLRLVRKRGKVRSSAAQRAGVHYVTASNTRIPNKGETDFKFKTKEGRPVSWCFQVAEVNKMLASVSDRVDAGCRVTYDKDMTTGIDLSTVYDKNTGETIKMRRDNNVWVVDAYIDIGDEDDDSVYDTDDDVPADSVFSRPE